MIFHPIFTTNDVGCVTGLGLGICYAIFREHGGDDKATSQIGKGTKFTIKLPVLAGACEASNHHDRFSDLIIRN